MSGIHRTYNIYGKLKLRSEKVFDLICPGISLCFIMSLFDPFQAKHKTKVCNFFIVRGDAGRGIGAPSYT